MEQASRTRTEEFYGSSPAEPTTAELGAELRRWVKGYNTAHACQALGYLTPAEFLTLRQAHQAAPDGKEV